MPRQAPMTQPTEDIPTNDPARHGQCPFLFRTERTPMIRTTRIRTTDQLANQLPRSFQAKDAMVTMIAHMHSPPALVTPGIFNFQADLVPRQALWPSTSH